MPVNIFLVKDKMSDTKHILVLKRVVEIEVILDKADIEAMTNGKAEAEKVWNTLTNAKVWEEMEDTIGTLETKFTSETSVKGRVDLVELMNGGGKRLVWRKDKDDEDVRAWFADEVAFAVDWIQGDICEGERGEKEAGMIDPRRGCAEKGCEECRKEVKAFDEAKAEAETPL